MKSHIVCYWRPLLTAIYVIFIQYLWRTIVMYELGLLFIQFVYFRILMISATECSNCTTLDNGIRYFRINCLCTCKHLQLGYAHMFHMYEEICILLFCNGYTLVLYLRVWCLNDMLWRKLCGNANNISLQPAI